MKTGSALIKDDLDKPELHRQALKLAAGELPEGWELLGSSRSARVVFHPELNIYYKEFLPRGPMERVKALLRGSRATRAARHSDELRAAGFDAPVNVARGTLSRRREYLISEAVAGQGVARWLQVDFAGRDAVSLARKRKLLRELGEFIGNLHAAGFIHGDLRPSNVLAHKEGPGYRFALIDNERNVHRQPPSGKLLLKNLMQLNMLLPSDLTRTDRWRFFQQWCVPMEELSPAEARVLATEAYLWAMRRLAAKQRP